MSSAARLPELRRLAGLRDRRADLALVEVSAAQRAVATATAALARRDAALAAHDRAQVALCAWLAAPAARDARLIEAALGRREAIAEARAEDEAAREAEARALAEAEAVRAEALGALARARGRRDAAGRQLATALGHRARALEAAAEVEFEDQRRPGARWGGAAPP